MDTLLKVTPVTNLIKPNLRGLNKNGQLITTFTKKWTLHNKLPPPKWTTHNIYYRGKKIILLKEVIFKEDK